MADIVALIDALAWPATITFMAFLFRAELRRAFGRLSSLKYKDLEAKFERQLNEAELKAGQVQAEASVLISLPEEVEREQQLLRLADISPRAAIMESWIAVEQAVLQLAERKGLPLRRGAADSRTMRDLLQRRVLDDKTFALVNQLRSLRNQAAHAPEFLLDSLEATRYANLALSLSRRLQGLAST
ncbi:MAG: DUF4145 domain-containing protein [Gemmatimonadales bacterium]|nr:DUF4145 domain-containing protein [Gemmatimonadales bacterium]